MKTLTVLLGFIILTGCTAPLGYVKFAIECNDMQGAMANDCTITVPENTKVEVDKETINIKYNIN